MRSIHKAKQILALPPVERRHQIFSALVLSLEENTGFRLNDLYLLSDEDRHLAMSVIKEWQLDRYYMGKAKPFQWPDQATDGQ